MENDNNTEFKLMSTSIIEGKMMDKKYISCGGDNISPGLSWSGEPKGTKSYAITMYDPDAPTGSGFWHWIVYDIPSQVTSIEEGQSTNMPEGSITSNNDRRSMSYRGPCPPKGHGKHHYETTVFALDVENLGVENPSEVSAAVIGFNLWSHTLAKKTITPYYENK